MFGRALVVLESLSVPLPEKWETREIVTRDHSLKNLGTVSIGEYHIGKEEMSQAATELSMRLKPTRYYAHIIYADTMLVSFPRITVVLQRGDEIGVFEICRKIGWLFSIPTDEMQFEKMFDEDHPDRI